MSKTKGAIQDQLRHIEYWYEQYHSGKKFSSFTKDDYREMLKEPCLMIHTKKRDGYFIAELYAEGFDITEKDVEWVQLLGDNSIKDITIQDVIDLREAGEKIYKLLS